MSFVHLHNHTTFSMLDGAQKLNPMIKAAVEDGQPAIATTDHGNVYSLIDFYKECHKQGIKPILGTEAYMARESVDERPRSKKKDTTEDGETDSGTKLYHHLTVLAENNDGYRNLLKLSSRAFLEGYYYKPRCLIAGQEIVTPGGMKRVEEIETGDLVLTHLGRFKPVTQVMSRHHDGLVYGVELSSGYSRVTWMTGEHPVLVANQDLETSWQEVDKIDPGRATRRQEFSSWNALACLPKPPHGEMHILDVRDHVSNWTTPHKQDWPSGPVVWEKTSQRSDMGPTRHFTKFADYIRLDGEFGRFLGLYIAEGWTSRSEVCLSFHRNETHLHQFCMETLERITGKKASLRNHEEKLETTITVSHSVLAELLNNLVGTGAGSKHMPHFVFDCSREFQHGIWSGVLEGDGSEYEWGHSLCQTSEALAWQMRTLGVAEGCFPGLTRQESDNEAHATQFRSNFGVGDGGHTREDEAYVYKPIANVIQQHYTGDVYNFEVEDDHSYVSDFAIHNCDWDMLSDHSEGLIVTTGCLGGVVLQELLKGRTTEALEAAARLQDIFGKDNMFVEVQDHGIPEQKTTNPGLFEIAKTINAPLVVTNDAHYTHQHDSHSHDVLLCCNTHSKLSDTDRFKFHGDQHYLKSAGEMRRLFPDYPETVSNTLWIGERCDVTIDFDQTHLPHFPCPDGFTEAEYLRHLVVNGAKERWAMTDRVSSRLEYELDTIIGMGMEGYFLILWDLVRHAHKVGIRTGPARGSAGGCAVSYALRITDIDPIRWGLLFERFLNPARVSMPDIDLDIPARFRDHMINYTREKYGDDRVCQIITFTQIGSRTAVRDAARVLDKPWVVGDRIAKALPPLVYGRDTPLSACMKEEPGMKEGFERAERVRKMYQQDPDVRDVIDAALGIEGLHKTDGIHAAAVVIAPGPLTDYVPVQRKPAKNKQLGPLVTQYDMHAVEDLGLLKMDFLGLKNLDIISDAVDLIEQRHGTKLDLSALEFDDGPTFDLLRAGKTVGVFQLESGPMQDLLRKLHPETFEDVAAVLALYRPGPMAANMHNDYADRKNGLAAVEVFHPDVEDLLSETYGLMVYQEQLMQVSMRLAGYELADGYKLVKTCAKKIPEAMAEERSKFEGGMIEKGYDAEFATSVFDMVAEFANYAFNKSHSYGYGVISYWTAYLKANYPVEFMTACLIAEGEQDRMGIVLNDARAMGIDVLPPDVNVSRRNFHPIDDNTISFGMTAVRGLGDDVSDEIVLERDTNGPFGDFFDFIKRAGKRSLNKAKVESLIMSGAFSSLGHPRQGLAAIFQDVIKQQQKDNKSAHEQTLFEVPTRNETLGVPDEEYEEGRLLELEREYLSVWLTGHPLEEVQEEVEAFAEISMAELSEVEEVYWRRSRVAGIVMNVNEIITKKGDPMKRFDLQDMSGSLSCVLFPSQTKEFGHLVNHGDILGLSVKPQDSRGAGVELIVEDVQQIKRGSQQGNAIHLFAPDAFPIETLKQEVRQTRGDQEVVLHWMGQTAKTQITSTLRAVKEILAK